MYGVSKKKFREMANKFIEEREKFCNQKLREINEEIQKMRFNCFGDLQVTKKNVEDIALLMKVFGRGAVMAFLGEYIRYFNITLREMKEMKDSPLPQDE